LFDLDAGRLPKVCQHGNSHAEYTAVFERYEKRSRSIEDDVITNPNPLPNPHASRAMQRDTKGLCPREYPSEVLQDSVREGA
jgi:hypothetical protein